MVQGEWRRYEEIKYLGLEGLTGLVGLKMAAAAGLQERLSCISRHPLGPPRPAAPS